MELPGNKVISHSKPIAKEMQIVHGLISPLNIQKHSPSRSRLVNVIWLNHLSETVGVKYHRVKGPSVPLILLCAHYILTSEPKGSIHQEFVNVKETII